MGMSFKKRPKQQLKGISDLGIKELENIRKKIKERKFFLNKYGENSKVEKLRKKMGWAKKLVGSR